VSDDVNFERFKKCAVEVLAVDPAKVTVDAKFGDDLDADSLDLVELVMALEEEFDVIETVGQALALVTAKL
jgi:acyl carrier protein